MRSLGSCEVVFDDVFVPEADVLGEAGEGWRQVTSSLNAERVMVAAMCTGILQGVLEDAVAYASQRHAFGKPIGQMQAIQHGIADIAMKLETARLLTYRAAWLEQNGKPSGVAATTAKETDMRRYWRDARLYRIDPITNNADQFNSILRRIFDVGIHPDNHRERAKSWDVISDINWYNHITEHWGIHLDDLAHIFRIVVIPDFTGPVAAEVIARWACEAPPPMIGGLLAAARNADLDMWHVMMHILEPVLAARWATDNSIYEHWDPERISRGVADYGGGDNRRRGIRGLLRH
jgi:hypothetical protein